MASVLGNKHIGDIIQLGNKVVRILGVYGKSVSVEQMGKDRLGRLRGWGEEGRFSTTIESVRKAKIIKRKRK